jgi:hypothetical protein
MKQLFQWMLLLETICGLCACGVSEGAFIEGADLDPCLANVPVCQTTAGCMMGEAKYIEGDFPGYASFVVTTPADTTIAVLLFFKSRNHPGEDTEIIWFEPGCRDSYRYESNGEDVFAKAGGDQIFAQEKKVRQAGDHLIQIYSDANCHFFARVELTTPT